MSGDAVELVVTPSGDIKTIYSERIDLAQFGKLSIRRGSHVEPTENGQWTADLSPCNGPLLGPFAGRSEAITAEIDWLSKHWLVQPADASVLYHVANILWDTDGEDASKLGLPSEVLMRGNPECFADALSDQFGWCINGLEVVRFSDSVSDAESEQYCDLPFASPVPSTASKLHR